MAKTKIRSSINKSVEIKTGYFSPITGWLEITADDIGITDISFVKQGQNPLRPLSHKLLETFLTELDDYFSLKSGAFSTPAHFTKGTPFHRKVWNELMKIPAGETRSYSQIAQAIGHPKACRAVGSANARNPLPILIPCHRVINSNGSLGGYSSGVGIKKSLLDLEKNLIADIPKEIEAKLIIVSSHPEEIAREISMLEHIDDLHLGNLHEDSFEDTYFDLPNGVLSGKMWALRSRRFGDHEKIALKGPASEHEDGALERTEHEMDWNREAPQRIRILLKGLKISISLPETSNAMNSEEFLKAVGFSIIQRRWTTRKTRKIFAQGNQRPVAELAIDKVVFDACSQKIQHHEIEIESLSRFDHSPVKKCLSFLSKKFSSSLIPWKYDKLTTVNVIIELMQCGRFNGISSGGHPEKSLYDQIPAHLGGE